MPHRLALAALCPLVLTVTVVSFTSLADICENVLMCPFDSSSMWACPGPWLLSHPWVAGLK